MVECLSRRSGSAVVGRSQQLVNPANPTHRSIACRPHSPGVAASFAGHDGLFRSGFAVSVVFAIRPVADDAGCEVKGMHRSGRVSRRAGDILANGRRAERADRRLATLSLADALRCSGGEEGLRRRLRQSGAAQSFRQLHRARAGVLGVAVCAAEIAGGLCRAAFSAFVIRDDAERFAQQLVLSGDAVCLVGLECLEKPSTAPLAVLQFAVAGGIRLDARRGATVFYEGGGQ